MPICSCTYNVSKLKKNLNSINQNLPAHLTTISVELGFLWDFVLLSLKTCSLYHEKLFIQKFKDISSQVLNNFFQPLKSWRLSEAVSVSKGL